MAASACFNRSSAWVSGQVLSYRLMPMLVDNDQQCPAVYIGWEKAESALSATVRAPLSFPRCSRRMTNSSPPNLATVSVEPTLMAIRFAASANTWSPTS